jgi:hypothetical protein
MEVDWLVEIAVSDGRRRLQHIVLIQCDTVHIDGILWQTKFLSILNNAYLRLLNWSCYDFTAEDSMSRPTQVPYKI